MAGQPCSAVLAPTTRHPAQLRDLLAPLGAAGNLTSDAHLAALALEHGGQVCSTDGDFARFPGVEVRAHADQLHRLAGEVGVSNLRLRDGGTVVVHSDELGYRKVVDLSRRISQGLAATSTSSPTTCRLPSTPGRCDCRRAARRTRGDSVTSGVDPWAEIYGYRSVLAHALPGEVSPDRVWYESVTDLPRLL